MIEEKYEALIDELKSTLIEAEFNSRWTLIEGYWKTGRLIREFAKQFQSGELTKLLQGIAVDIERSERTLWYAVKLYDRYPSLDMVPEGKNISWSKLVNKYLPDEGETKEHTHEPITICRICRKVLEAKLPAPH